ncbi:MAG: hypothetical protein ACYDCO_22835 [Armatimonadota bacterium]
MRKILVLLITLILGLAVLLSGCGSGGDDAPMAPGVTLEIGAETGTGATGMTKADVSLLAPLDAGATVTVSDFRTGAVIRTGTLDSEGFCPLSNITTGLTVAIVVTGSRSGVPYRLSTILANVPNSNGTVVLTPATSIAAEALAQQFYQQNQIIDTATFEQVLDAAQTYVDANPGANYSLNGTLLQGSTFGVDGNLDESALSTVFAAVPDTVDNDIVLAKNAVQQIREAGFTLNQMVQLPPPDFQNIFTQAVIDNYNALGERLNILMLPAILGDMDYYNGSSWQYGIPIMALTPGKAYKVTTNYGGYLEITDDSGNDTPGQVILSDNTSGTVYTLVARQTSGTTMQITQTSSGDALMQYRATVTLPIGPDESNPTVQVSISLRDAVYTTPLTFVGTINAVGADLDHYTRITYHGTLTTPEVTSNCELQANFPAAMPAGAEPGAQIYEFPTSFSMTDTNLVFHGPDFTVTLEGEITATSELVTGDDGYTTILPKTFSLSGGYADTGNGIDFDGEISASWDNPSMDAGPTTINGAVNLAGRFAREGFPTYAVDLSFIVESGDLDTTIDLQAGGYRLQGTGSATITATGDVINPTITLTNQAGVTFYLADGPSGTVTVGTTQVATISEGEFGGIRISFTDSTFEEIF